MSRRKSLPLPPTVSELASRIQHWRATRQKRSPMPGELWDEATTLARLYGTYPIAHALGVNYTNLKNRAESTRPAKTERKQPADEVALPPAFVEVTASPLASGSGPWETTVELSAKDGAKMVIRMQGRAALELQQLMAAFWRRGS